MAITAPMKTSDFSGFLSPQESAPIFDEAAKQSAFQQLIPRVELGINGQKIPVMTGKPTANWVGQGERKPTTEGKFGMKLMEPKKLAAITVMSAEVARANPANVSTRMREAITEAIATAFDLAVAYNLGGDGTGTGPFDNYLAETTKSVTVGSTAKAEGGIHGDLTAAMAALVADKRKLTGWALDDNVEPLIWGATDTNGRPLYVELPTDSMSQTLARPGRLLNRPSFMGEGVGHGDTVGFGGNFQKAAWGAVGGIGFRISTEATVTINGELVSLFENNLVAILAEAEYGFVMESPEHFVKLQTADSGAGA